MVRLSSPLIILGIKNTNEFLEVVKREKYKLDTDVSYEDECYYGIVNILARLQTNRIMDIGLEKLAAVVFAAALGNFSKDSVTCDYRLKLGVGMMNSAVLDVPLNETALIVIVKMTTMAYSVRKCLH